jgi:hypothetical protein
MAIELAFNNSEWLGDIQPISLRDQPAFPTHAMPEFLRDKKLANAFDYRFGKAESTLDDEAELMDKYIELYCQQENIQIGELNMHEILEVVLSLAKRYTIFGHVNEFHQEGVAFKPLSQYLYVDPSEMANSPKIKCNVYNGIVQRFFEHIVSKDARLIGKVKLLNISASYSQDIGYMFFESGRMQPHGYLMLTTSNGENLQVSAVDAYHERNKSEEKVTLEKVDYTSFRRYDLLLEVALLALDSMSMEALTGEKLDHWINIVTHLAGGAVQARGDELVDLASGIMIVCDTYDILLARMPKAITGLAESFSLRMLENRLERFALAARSGDINEKLVEEAKALASEINSYMQKVKEKAHEGKENLDGLVQLALEQVRTMVDKLEVQSHALNISAQDLGLSFITMFDFARRYDNDDARIKTLIERYINLLRLYQDVSGLDQDESKSFFRIFNQSTIKLKLKASGKNELVNTMIKDFNGFIERVRGPEAKNKELYELKLLE